MKRTTTIAILVLLVAAVLPLSAEDRESYLFQTVLLLGTSDGSSDLSDVPDNVVKALDDVTRFLPYESYRMIDTSILRSAGHARGRFASPSGQEFELEFHFGQQDADSLLVRSFELTLLQPQPRDRVKVKDGKADVESNPPAWVRKEVIASQFDIEVGETIVVGTSKMNGSGQALIVLFTAMP